MDAITIISEDRIKQAINDGEFTKLPGKGKPLKMDDLSHVPEEIRMGYRLLKNANYLPEEAQLKREMVKLEDLIACCYDPEERVKLKEKLTEKQLRLDTVMKKRQNSNSAAMREYFNKITERLR